MDAPPSYDTPNCDEDKSVIVDPLFDPPSFYPSFLPPAYEAGLYDWQFSKHWKYPSANLVIGPKGNTLVKWFMQHRPLDCNTFIFTIERKCHDVKNAIINCDLDILKEYLQSNKNKRPTWIVFDQIQHKKFVLSMCYGHTNVTLWVVDSYLPPYVYIFDYMFVFSLYKQLNENMCLYLENTFSIKRLQQMAIQSHCLALKQGEPVYKMPQS